MSQAHVFSNMTPVCKNGKSILYQATYKNNNVAVKYIPRRYAVVDEVNLEVKALQQLQGNRNVVRYIDMIEQEKDIFIIMEWVNGMNLKQYVQGLAKPLTEYQVRDIIFQIVNVLYYCNSMNYIYGDVKPDNIMIQPSGTVKLVDFGCTRNIGKLGRNYLGTPLYFSPEMFDQIALPQYDVWGLGIVMYYLASGEHPFIKEPPVDITDLKNKIMDTQLEFKSPVWKEWSDDGLYLLLQLLEKDPFKRPSINYVHHNNWFYEV